MPVVNPTSSCTGATVSEVLTSAAQGLGFLGIGEVLGAAFANRGLSTFNSMLDSWAGENLASYANQETTFSLVAGTSQYTIGSGATVDATRPDNIYQAYITDANGLRYPLTVVPQDKWNRIGDLGITSQIPTTLFYDPQYHYGVINIFPVPLLAYQVTISSILQQNTFSSLPQTVCVPPGYLRAYTTNLSVEMISAGFPCMLNDRALARLYENASEAKANIKRKNIKEAIATYDGAIVASGFASYNVYSDSNPRSS